MKKLSKLLLYVSIIIVVFAGCKKEPVIPTFNEFGDEIGPKIVDGELYVDAHRGGLSHPDACDAIAVLITDDIENTWKGEAIDELDGFTISATDIYRKQEGYESIWNWWDVTRTKLIKELQGKDKDIVNDEVVRALPIFAKMLESRVIPYVMDGICYGGGVRNDWTDQWIRGTFNDTIPYDIDHPSYKPTPRMECYYYIYYYAVDPGNYAEAKSMGMTVPSVDSLQVMFPITEIKQQTDLVAYRKQTQQKYDFRQPDWKALPVNSTK